MGEEAAGQLDREQGFEKHEVMDSAKCCSIYIRRKLKSLLGNNDFIRDFQKSSVE